MLYLYKNKKLCWKCLQAEYRLNPASEMTATCCSTDDKYCTECNGEHIVYFHVNHTPFGVPLERITDYMVSDNGGVYLKYKDGQISRKPIDESSEVTANILKAYRFVRPEVEL